ncbi:MAG: SixA phosphatase family protein [Opitutaceae bacterium]
MLYLVRHADAEDAPRDAERPLSREGREQASRLAAFLQGCPCPPPDEIWHSPLVRTRQTAEIMARGMGWKAPLRVVDGLLPDEPPALVGKTLPASARVAIFGHNPQISLLATWLVAGRAPAAGFAFKKCTALALEPGGRPGGWVARWQIDPDLLR